MEKDDLFSVVLLCIINIIFMFTGIFLNSVVIISLWRSRQLRKKLCYFMVLVLSCFDLAVVGVTHPLVISSSVYMSIDNFQGARELRRVFISFILFGFSMCALFTLNIERFLALMCPFFHQALVSRKRLICFFAFLSLTVVGVSPLIFINRKTVVVVHILSAIYVLFMLSLSIYTNYKIFVIAKSKRVNNNVSPNIKTAKDEKRRKRITNLKKISTCTLAVGCYCFCCCPIVAYSVLRLVSGAPSYKKQVLLFNLWSNTFISINSTLNCVIFFWRNSVLRHEGMKAINALKRL